MKSFYYKKEIRLNDAIKAHAKYKHNFPEAENLEETEKLLENLNLELTTIIAQKTETNGL